MRFGVLGGGGGCGGTPGYSHPVSLRRRGCRECFPCSAWCPSPGTPRWTSRAEASLVGLYKSPAVLVGNCGMKRGQRTIFQRLVLAQCPHGANTLWICSPWVVCSVSSLGDAPSVYFPFHGHVFPSSVVSMVFVVEKQLCVAPRSPCAISFP